ncbi:phage tail protein I [Burkholderia sp. Ac-20345]|uniref:phage tail protein I n=1 Tax=Burkholderia sp. Ac-20345 TaxID=2703891 RepID=UPI00197B9417|nr:phage tail protein I [Burkholderia sp. Ac-20345]MBN3779910.1 phage tail protein I [Burkholderia sp. Ac-20345]
MTDFVDPSLLVPPLARDLNARALETIGASAVDIDLTPLVVADFDTVPADALPALAEQWRMLGDAGWAYVTTEAQKRALLKQAGALHRIHGAPDPVMRILTIIGVTATMTEWFRQTPQGAPYTFVLNADTLDQPDGAPPLDLKRWGEIARVVNFWKNGRSGFKLTASSAGIGLGTGIAMIANGEEQGHIIAEFAAVDFPMQTLGSPFPVTMTQYGFV